VSILDPNRQYTFLISGLISEQTVTKFLALFNIKIGQ